MLPGFHFLDFLLLLLILLWIGMLLDCLLNKGQHWREKVLWLFVLFCSPLLGALLYFFIIFLRRLLNKNEVGSLQDRQSDQPWFPLPPAREQEDYSAGSRSHFLDEQPQAVYPEMKQDGQSRFS
jgi:hypothetical protein